VVGSESNRRSSILHCRKLTIREVDGKLKVKVAEIRFWCWMSAVNVVELNVFAGDSFNPPPGWHYESAVAD